MRKWLILGCKEMREGVVVSAIFFMSGILMFLAASYVVPDFGVVRHIVILAGLLLMLLAPIILVSTFLLSVLPSSKKETESCGH
ncbi:MAG: hypothetical protein KZQ80_17315 [Candidatus Thiodiazotropha sp. (ex Monitilora ramsayi)]|nr:hypothetical protein [Candidatus Thiodiazotropha sp. (ex Monitilora ramsayi)]